MRWQSLCRQVDTRVAAGGQRIVEQFGAIGLIVRAAPSGFVQVFGHR
jgi:hypothetical protein